MCVCVTIKEKDGIINVVARILAQRKLICMHHKMSSLPELVEFAYSFILIPRWPHLHYRPLAEVWPSGDKTKFWDGQMGWVCDLLL